MEPARRLEDDQADERRSTTSAAISPGRPVTSPVDAVGEPAVGVVEEVDPGADPDDPALDLGAPQRLDRLELEERDRGEHEAPALEPAEQRADLGARCGWRRRSRRRTAA